ncbi:MAG: acetyltransferase [Sphingobacteriia bacterium]|nr:acetyltransferase [Sphingobacteriia bacterium]
MKPLLIWGCGGLGREVLVIAENLGIEVLGFLDERPEMKGQIVEGLPIIGDLNDYDASKSNVDVTFGVGDPFLKSRLYHKTINNGFQISPPLIHPSVIYTKRGFEIGPGSVICAGSALMVQVKLGIAININQLCSIGHDCKMGDFVTVSPGVMISGNVSIGNLTFLGTGAVIREKINIGEQSIIAGAAFIGKDVPDKVLMAGVPAIEKRKL